MTTEGTTEGRPPAPEPAPPHEAGDPPSACTLCGTPAEDPHAVLTWTLEVVDEGWNWLCTECSRDHVRDIEARLELDDWA